jgi:tetratricopeptide (TPR) repeat protein
LRQKVIETYQIWNRTYPNDFVPHSNLAVAYEEGGELDKAAEEFRAAIALAPDETLPRTGRANVYLNQSRVDEARKTLEEMTSRGLDSTAVRLQLYAPAFFNHDDAAMARQIEAARRFPDAFRLLGTEVGVALCRGQLAKGIALAERFESEASSKAGLSGSAAGTWISVAGAAATMGDAGAARATAGKGLAIERSVPTLLNGAFALAWSAILRRRAS